MKIIKGGNQILETSQEASDKLGVATDLWGVPDKTVLAYANAAYQHIHMPGYIWPNDCTLVSCLTSATENTFGDFVQLVPKNGIVAPYDCHWVTVSDITANGVYIVEFHLVSDDPMVTQGYLTAFSAARVSAFSRSTQVSVQMPAIAGGRRVAAKAKKSGAGEGTIRFNIHYHEYE